MEGEGVGGFLQEAGGHRIQRVPDNERRGRVHTSTVTVAVHAFGSDCPSGPAVTDSDIRIEWFHGSGAGGQHRNKHANCARVIHIPTGLRKEVQGRSRQANLRAARGSLEADIANRNVTVLKAGADTVRRDQVGSGMRGDKRRTYRFQDGMVNDHVTNGRTSTTRALAGFVDDLWK